MKKGCSVICNMRRLDFICTRYYSLHTSMLRACAAAVIKVTVKRLPKAFVLSTGMLSSGGQIRTGKQAL